MNKYININSELDALKIKDIEKIFYSKIEANSNIVPKVTPFKGINTDMLYIKDNKVLFVKFMDTTDDLFSILEDELLEVMNEEYELLKLRMEQSDKNIKYNYIFIMPYVEIEENYQYKEFINNNIIDKNQLYEIIDSNIIPEQYFKETNNEIELNLFLLSICPEYYVINDKLHLNEKFKKISFYNEEYKYTATMLEEEQIVNVNSIKYGNTLFNGGSGTAKTTLMLGRALKLSRVYPHHKFLILTHSKQACNELRERVALLYDENNNIEIHTLNSFVIKLAKKYNLIIDYGMLKNDYDKTFNNLVKQAKNVIKNKNMFKGIFIDEGEAFSTEELSFIREFLYKTKYIFNISSCEALNVSKNLNIFKNNLEQIYFDQKLNLNRNYRQSEYVSQFINKFAQNSNEYIFNLRENLNNKFNYTTPIIKGNKDVEIIKVTDLDEQISSIIWEVEYLINKKGLCHSDIVIVYPYNKKKLKNGKTIYFQYMLKKALEEAQIPYIYAEDNLTNLSKKVGVTISNIFAVKNLEYRACIIGELEMLYNHTINDKTQDYQINDFVGDLNKIYVAMNRACEYLSIITTFNEQSSELIKLLIKSK
ncbi:MAG: DNA helicase [Peptostreptococcaceae bacterium]